MEDTRPSNMRQYQLDAVQRGDVGEGSVVDGWGKSRSTSLK